MNNEKLEAGLASDLNRELDTGIAINSECVKCKSELNQLQSQITDYTLALISCKNRFNFFKLLHAREKDTEKSKSCAEMVKMLLATLGYGTSTTSGEWQPIETLKQQNWLNDGNVYDEYGAYCGNVKSGTMPEVWVAIEPQDRNPTHWQCLPVGI
jgi:hypothetical protein